MRVLGNVGPPPARSSRWWMRDVLVTVLVALSSVPYFVDGYPKSRVLAILVIAALTAPLLVRRVWPSEVFGVLFVISAAAGLWDVRLVANLSLVVALYTIAALQSRRRALVAAALLEAGVIAAVIRLASSGWWQAAIMGSGLVAAALGLGLYSSTRHAYLKELRDRAERLERERDQQTALSAAAERARISNEMHDILAHHLTVIVALSEGAAAASASSPHTAAEVMRTVSATGRRALADIRQLLDGPGAGIPDSAGRHPLPDLSGLDALVENVRAAGVPVSYELEGSPAELGPGAQLTVYRLVQEALTNTLKHAGHGASAVVRLRYLPGEVRLDVEDDGIGVSSAGPETIGRGLAGMRQRVHAFGGDVQAGPKLPVGWRVSAHLRLNQETST